MRPDKPTYSTTRMSMKLNTALAWLTILAIVAAGLAGRDQAVQLASIVVPSMILLIASLLGIHRFSGAMDLRSQAMISGHDDPDPEDEAPANRPRDKPERDRAE